MNQYPEKQMKLPPMHLITVTTVRESEMMSMES